MTITSDQTPHTLESETETRVSPAVREQLPRRRTLRDRWRALEPLTRRTDADGPTDAVMDPTSRLLAALLSLVPLPLGLLARATGAGTLGSVLLAVFMTVGFGVAVVSLVPRLTRLGFVVYAAASGLAVTTAVGYAMALTGLWYPRVAFAVAAVAAAALLVRAVVVEARRVSAGRTRTAHHRPAGATRDLAVVGALAGLGTVLAAVDAATHATLPQPSGLLGTVGPLWYVGYALIAVSFVVALLRRVLVAAPVLAAGTVVILSQALLYEAPTVMAAARHIGIEQYVLGFGRLDLAGDIYQGWAGLFVGGAWIAASTGLSSLSGLLGIATWWPVVITPITVAAVRLLAGRFLDPQRAWIAAAVFALGDAVNSTYFSPQAYGFLLAITVLALLVAPPATDGLDERALRRVRLTRWGVALGLSVAVTVTHQISPFMLAFALIALVAFRLVKPWWLPLLAIVPAIGWAGFNWRLIARYINIGDLGAVLANIAPPEHPVSAAPVAAVTRLAFYVPAAALVVFGIVALVTVLQRRDRLHWGLAFAFVSPVGLAFGTNYGQEGVFRIVLFAAPWLGVLVAAALPAGFGSRVAERAAGLGRRAVRTGAAALAPVIALGFAAMMAVNVYGQTGLDWARILRPGDAQVTSIYEQRAVFGSMLFSLGTKNATPARITDRYDQVDYSSRVRVDGFPTTTGSAYDPVADLNQVTYTLQSTPIRGDVYLYVSDSIGGYDDRYGLQTWNDYQRLRAAVADSPYWVEVGRSDTARLYELKRDLQADR